MSGAPTPETGLIVAGYGRHYIVETPEGRRLICHPRGKKSECVVGDRVKWLPTGDSSGEGVIEKVEPRRNLLFRQDEWKSKSFAANLDQILVVVACDPPFSESQLARALIAAESAGIPARILLNKADLPQIVAARTRLAPYVAMGYEVIEVALKGSPEPSHETIAPLLRSRVTLVLGPSGAGKSTLINLMVPSAAAQVGEISQALQAGRHTTTATQWYWVKRGVKRGVNRRADDGPGNGPGTETDHESGSGLIDSPGFQEFGLKQIEASQLPGYMPDLREAATHCRFYNCTHLHEPGCGVLAAVETKQISPSRHRIYREIFEELSRKRW